MSGCANYYIPPHQIQLIMWVNAFKSQLFRVKILKIIMFRSIRSLRRHWLGIANYRVPRHVIMRDFLLQKKNGGCLESKELFLLFKLASNCALRVAALSFPSAFVRCFVCYEFDKSVFGPKEKLSCLFILNCIKGLRQVEHLTALVFTLSFSPADKLKRCVSVMWRS